MTRRRRGTRPSRCSECRGLCLAPWDDNAEPVLRLPGVLSVSFRQAARPIANTLAHHEASAAVGEISSLAGRDRASGWALGFCELPNQTALPRTWHPCTCEYVTDFDQNGVVAVEVFVARKPRRRRRAQLGRAGVGAIVSCSCQAKEDRAPCQPTDTCREPVNLPNELRTRALNRSRRLGVPFAEGKRLR